MDDLVSVTAVATRVGTRCIRSMVGSPAVNAAMYVPHPLKKGSIGPHTGRDGSRGRFSFVIGWGPTDTRRESCG